MGQAKWCEVRTRSKSRQYGANTSALHVLCLTPVPMKATRKFTKFGVHPKLLDMKTECLFVASWKIANGITKLTLLSKAYPSASRSGIIKKTILRRLKIIRIEAWGRRWKPTGVVATSWSSFRPPGTRHMTSCKPSGWWCGCRALGS
jgi:hypothetical protein